MSVVEFRKRFFTLTSEYLAHANVVMPADKEVFSTPITDGNNLNLYERTRPLTDNELVDELLEIGREDCATEEDVTAQIEQWENRRLSDFSANKEVLQAEAETDTNTVPAQREIRRYN